jgi:uncharacterized protein (TIGR02186 family)
MRRIVPAVLVILIACGVRPAAAERLVVSLSNHRVQVTSSFTGEDLVLFGSIEPDKTQPKLRSDYDLVVTVTGPRETMRARSKGRVMGIWVNVGAREFVRVPSYLAVLSNRPVDQITNEATRLRLQIGLDNFVLPQRIGPDIADTVRNDPYRVAFVRLQGEKGLYRQSAKAVTFLTPSVFRVAIPLPADTPTGSYKIDVMLFSDGKVVARTNTALEVIKTGFEQFVAGAAVNYGLLYGIVTAMMALSIGWLASVVFRRD